MPVDSRYYFLSSLPMLRFGDKAPMSWDSFVEYAQERVPSSDLELLTAISNGEYKGNRFLREFKEFCDTANNAVNVRRKVALGKDAVVSSQEDFDTAKFGNAVMATKNPLDAELLIMKYKFDYLEKKLAFKAFSQDVVLGYALELRILLRKDLFNVENGNAEYQKLFGKVKEEINVEKVVAE